jgi:uncharacterized protein (DUF885 family)
VSVHRRALSTLVAGLSLGCTTVPNEPPAEPRPAPFVARDERATDCVPTDAATGVSAPELVALLNEHWAFAMRESPVWATRLGIHRFDDRLGDRSEQGYQRRRAKNRELLARAQQLDAAKLPEGDQVTLRLLVEELATSIKSEVCEYELWTLSPRNNPVTEWNQLHETHRVEQVEDGKNLLSRYREIPRVIDWDSDNLRRGAKRDLFANAESTRRVIAMVEKQLAQPFEEWPLLTPAKAPHPSWPAAALLGFQKSLRETVEREIKPAFERYLTLLKTEIAPKARGPEAEGVGALGLGKACYAAEIQRHTTLEKSADELHALGLREGERIDREMLELGKKLFKKYTLAEVLRTLRSDPKLYFTTEAEIVKAAEVSLARAKAKMPEWFGVLPKADCIVRKIPDYEAPFTTIAYYKQPNADGSKPGEYFVNVSEPQKRPRFEAEVLAVHESIPGHHLQIAIAQERGELPAFRKHSGATAFVEGWGLYTERLAQEMGLYSADLDRMGVLSFDAWRASRLVVDTGIHHKGWTRAQAEKYMLEHTALTELNVKNEVDRYITWPGQALAYKVGQLEIIALRRLAEEKLGKRFSLPKFHDAVLSGGAVTLPELRRQIESFIAASSRPE